MDYKVIEDRYLAGEYDSLIEDLDQLNIDESLHYKNYIGILMQRNGDYQKALELSTRILEQTIENNNFVEQLGARALEAYANFRLTNYDKVDEIILKSEELIFSLEDHNLTNSEQIIFRKYEGTILNIKGLLSSVLGELDDALKYFQLSLKVRQELGDKEGIAISFSNISRVYQIKGELDNALEFNLQAMELFLQVENELLLSHSIYNIAKTYRMKGDLNLSYEFCLKSLNIRKNLRNLDNIAESYFDLIITLLDLEEVSEAQKYYDELNLLTLNNDYKNIVYYQKLAKAILLKKQNRIISYSKAKSIFEEVINGSIFRQELTVLALLHLCDLYFFELKAVNNENLIKEISHIVDMIYNIAHDQNSFYLLCESYVLKSKLSLIALDITKAQILLGQAEMIAIEKGFNKLELRISVEQDNLINKLSKWDELRKENAPLIKRLAESDVEKTLSSMIRQRKMEEIDTIDDFPIFVMILTRDGVVIYSKSFDNSIQINEQLIGGFIMASNFGLSEALQETSEENIERIKYGKYNLIFKSHENIIFSYAFKGNSFPAMQRLNDFIQFIIEGEVWPLIKKKLPSPKTIEMKIGQQGESYFVLPKQGLFDDLLSKKK